MRSVEKTVDHLIPLTEFPSTAVTLTIITTIAQMGKTSPVAASGTPTPLNRNDSTTFCCSRLRVPHLTGHLE